MTFWLHHRQAPEPGQPWGLPALLSGAPGETAGAWIYSGTLGNRGRLSRRMWRGCRGALAQRKRAQASGTEQSLFESGVSRGNKEAGMKGGEGGEEPADRAALVRLSAAAWAPCRSSACGTTSARPRPSLAAWRPPRRSPWEALCFFSAICKPAVWLFQDSRGGCMLACSDSLVSC